MQAREFHRPMSTVAKTAADVAVLAETIRVAGGLADGAGGNPAQSKRCSRRIIEAEPFQGPDVRGGRLGVSRVELQGGLRVRSRV